MFRRTRWACFNFSVNVLLFHAGSWESDNLLVLKYGKVLLCAPGDANIPLMACICVSEWVVQVARDGWTA
jgi:hypothetical protein